MTKLFWKIFFWLVAVNLGLATFFFLLSGERLSLSQQKLPVEKVRNIQLQRILSVAYLIEHAGADVARDYLLEIPQTKPRVWVLNKEGEELLNRAIPFFLKNSNQVHHQIVLSPSNREFDVFSYMPDETEEKALLAGNYTKIIRPIFYFGGGLLACIWLAWYLSRPVKLLTDGAKNISKGTFDKVLPKLGNRKDELVSLAYEFDNMANEIQTKQTALKQVLSDVSHELRSPLTRVRLSLGLLEQQQQKVTVKNLAKVTHELDRLDELIDQILTVVQLENNPNYPLDDYIELKGLLSSIISNISIELENKSCDISFEKQSVLDDLVMKGNKELLYRAFENIIRNAVKHTPDQSKVIVKISHVGTDICIQFIDNGPGVPENELQNIFTPFSRLETSRSTEGYGLGLTICQRAIEHNNGKITAKNGDNGLIIEVIFPQSIFEASISSLK